MAHIIKVRYGLSNLSKKEYTYLANNNVKKGTVIMPSVKHAKTGKIYATMGVVQSSQGGTRGDKSLQELKNEGIDVVGAQKIDKSVTNSLRARDTSGKFVYTGQKGLKSKGTSVGKFAFASDENYDPQSKAVQAQKENVVKERETFDSYYDSTIGKENSNANNI